MLVFIPGRSMATPACSGIRYATSLAGRDRAIVVVAMSGSKLSHDAGDAFAHAVMYASWDALDFRYSDAKINVDFKWERQP